MSLLFKNTLHQFPTKCFVSLSLMFRSWFKFIPLCIDFVCYLTFLHHIFQISILVHKSVDYCSFCICCYGLDQTRSCQVAVFGIKCPADVIALYCARLLCYCMKDSLHSLLGSGRQIFYWSKLTMPSPCIQL